MEKAKIIIQLDAVRKNRSQSEWRMIPRARAEGFEAKGDGKVICNLCAQMIKAGYPHSQQVEVWRDETQVFQADTLIRWAERRAGKGKQPEQLRQNRDLALPDPPEVEG